MPEEIPVLANIEGLIKAKNKLGELDEVINSKGLGRAIGVLGDLTTPDLSVISVDLNGSDFGPVAVSGINDTRAFLDVSSVGFDRAIDWTNIASDNVAEVDFSIANKRFENVHASDIVSASLLLKLKIQCLNASDIGISVPNVDTFIAWIKRDADNTNPVSKVFLPPRGTDGSGIITVSDHFEVALPPGAYVFVRCFLLDRSGVGTFAKAKIDGAVADSSIELLKM